MKPIVFYNDKFLNAVSWFFKVGGISLFPFIILREQYQSTSEFWTKRRKKVINHETIHFQQALECGIIPFYFIYVLEYLIKILFIYLNVNTAYKSISFEREAYDNEWDFEYLKNRKRYSWIKRFIK